jgi:hypothetical protein
VGELVEGGSATNVAGGDGGARAETGGGDLVVEDRAVVDLFDSL